MKKRTLLFAVPLLFGLGVRDAQALDDGRTLLNYCEAALAPGDAKGLVCIGYVRGFMAGIVYSSTVNTSAAPYCVPANSSYEQYLRVIVKYLQGSPQDLHRPSPILIVDALAKAFPCKNPR